MKTYHTTAVRGQSVESSRTLALNNRPLMLLSRLRALQVQLRHGRKIHASDLVRLFPYCADSGGPEGRA
jgi:hypothetical protein